MLCLQILGEGPDFEGGKNVWMARCWRTSKSLTEPGAFLGARSHSVSKQGIFVNPYGKDKIVWTSSIVTSSFLWLGWRLLGWGIFFRISEKLFECRHCNGMSFQAPPSTEPVNMSFRWNGENLAEADDWLGQMMPRYAKIMITTRGNRVLWDKMQKKMCISKKSSSSLRRGLGAIQDPPLNSKWDHQEFTVTVPQRFRT